MLNSAEGAHMQEMSIFEVDEHLQATMPRLVVVPTGYAWPAAKTPVDE